MVALKPRPVLSVADAVTRLIDDIGAMPCATAVGKSSGLIYRWANPDDDTKPSLEQAIMLDQLWLMSGRCEPPLLAAYRARLGALGAAGQEPRADLRDRVMGIGAEFGELSADVARALADSVVSAADAARLAKDLRDMRGKMDAMERQLAAVAKGRGA